MAMVDYALRYADLGFAVLPLVANTKLPSTSRGFHDATTDPVKIRDLFSRDRNLGLVVPPGYFLVDIDRLDAARAFDLPATPRQRTPRGGLHLLYSLPEGVEMRQTTGELAPGIDTRAAGRGYFVVEPSSINGHAYEWIVFPDRSNITEAPDWLVTFFSSRHQSNGGRSYCHRSWDFALTMVPEGRRNDTLASVTGCLLGRGIDVLLACELVHSYNRTHCQPPLPDIEVAAVLDSIARKELAK